jgi:hypothetical protein
MERQVEKMYENAGIKKDWTAIGFGDIEDCYPPFTAEKLINLEMFLINKGDFDIKKGSVDITFESFTSCIAGLINNLWQDLTEEERKQIKEILE